MKMVKINVAGGTSKYVNPEAVSHITPLNIGIAPGGVVNRSRVEMTNGKAFDMLETPDQVHALLFGEEHSDATNQQKPTGLSEIKKVE